MNNWKVIPKDAPMHLYVPLIFAIEGFGSSDVPNNDCYLEEFLNEIDSEVGGEPGWSISRVNSRDGVKYRVWNSLENPAEQDYSEHDFWMTLQKILVLYIRDFPHEKNRIYKVLKMFCPVDLLIKL